MTHNVQWTVSLSNGETLHEGKGEYRNIEGALSPWQRLLQHVIETKTSMTSLSLYTADGQRWNLPSSGNNPKFRAFDLAPKPIDFNMFRAVGADIGGLKDTQGDLFTVAEAIFDTCKLQIWVNEKNTRISWTILI